MTYRLVGQVPFGASCRSCQKFDSAAGAYWEREPPSEKQMKEFAAAYECQECARIRKIVREELAALDNPPSSR